MTILMQGSEHLYYSHGFIDGLQIHIAGDMVYLKMGEQELKVSKDVFKRLALYL